MKHYYLHTEPTTTLADRPNTINESSGIDVVPSAASDTTVPAAVGGAVGAGCVVLVILTAMMVVIFTVWRKRSKKWTIAAANGVAQTNEYPMTNPVYKGKFYSLSKGKPITVYM